MAWCRCQREANLRFLPTQFTCALTGAPLPDEAATRGDGMHTSLQFGMKQVPDMHHLGPDLQIDVDIRGSGGFRQSKRIIEQGLGRANLDEQWREPIKIGIDR